jgi:hypothetical protein
MAGLPNLKITLQAELRTGTISIDPLCVRAPDRELSGASLTRPSGPPAVDPCGPVYCRPIPLVLFGP